MYVYTYVCKYVLLFSARGGPRPRAVEAWDARGAGSRPTRLSRAKSFCESRRNLYARTTMYVYALYMYVRMYKVVASGSFCESRRLAALRISSCPGGAHGGVIQHKEYDCMLCYILYVSMHSQVSMYTYLCAALRKVYSALRSNCFKQT